MDAGLVWAAIGSLAGVAGAVLVAWQLWLQVRDRRQPRETPGAPGTSVSAAEWVSVTAPEGRLPAGIRLRGRDELLAELRRDLFRRGRRPGRTWVLTGMGGAGKSAVALATASAARGRGWQVWWVTASDAVSFRGGVLEVLRRNGAPESILQAVREGASTAADQFTDFLNDPRRAGRRWLLVFDNADDPAVLAAACKRSPADHDGWLRPDPTGTVIVTSRDSDPKTWGPRIVLRPVSLLDDLSAAQVLTDLAPDAGDRDGQQARLLASHLGGLPLALHLAGSYLASPFARWESFAAYAEALDNAQLPAALADLDGPHADDRTTIQKTWELSLNGLDNAGIPQARPLLSLLACYASGTPIPVPLLRPGLLAEILTPAGGPAGADGGTAADPERVLRDGLESLHRVGLISVAQAAVRREARTVIVHPVVADSARARLRTTDQDSLPLIGGLAVRLVISEASQLDCDRPADWPGWQRLTPHVRALLTWLAGTLPVGELAGLLELSSRTATALLRSGDFAAAEIIARLGEDEAARLGDDHPVTLELLFALARATGLRAGYGEAMQLLGRVIDGRTQVLGEDHPDTLAARHEMARVTFLRGNYQQAERQWLPLSTQESRILGDDHPTTLLTGHWIAELRRAQGHLEEAERISRDVLTRRSRRLGENHPDTMVTCFHLGMVIGLLARNQEAEQLFRDLLTRQSRVLGPRHPQTLRTRHYVAWTLMRQDKLKQAENLFYEVLREQTQTLGIDHTTTLTTRDHLAVLHMNLREFSKAEQILQLVIADRTRLFGPEYPPTLSSLETLAVVKINQGGHSRRGPIEEGLAILRHVHEVRGRVLGDNHLDTRRARESIQEAEQRLRWTM